MPTITRKKSNLRKVKDKKILVRQQHDNKNRKPISVRQQHDNKNRKPILVRQQHDNKNHKSIDKIMAKMTLPERKKTNVLHKKIEIKQGIRNYHINNQRNPKIKRLASSSDSRNCSGSIGVKH